MRGFSEGKSDVANTQLPLFKQQHRNYFYMVLWLVFHPFMTYCLVKIIEVGKAKSKPFP